MIPTPNDPVATLVFFLVVFTVIGVVFLFMHLVMGSVIRPRVPDPEKLTIYECGEPTVGSAWIQFDLRFYVVALLFVIFDVEVAFFFPWATVFGKANQLANLPAESQMAGLSDVEKTVIEKRRQELSQQLLPSGLSRKTTENLKLATYKPVEDKSDPNATGRFEEEPFAVPIKPEAAAAWARIAFFDILVFFGVLLVGFAYVWRRGDIDWVRAFDHHVEPKIAAEKPAEQEKIMV
jgi:NADH-quinone oxidoreductase subunit A